MEKGPEGAGPGLTGCPLQENGELCMNSAQCKSQCCQHTGALDLARCIPLASENNECSVKTLYGIYYKCPCERGLTCEGDKTIVGAITNTNFGVCHDIGTLDAPSSETAHPLPYLAQNAADH
ncbi:colipase isoform X2 [Macaca mulatta]